MSRTKKKNKWIKRGLIFTILSGIAFALFTQQQNASRLRLIENTNTMIIEQETIELFALASGKLTSANETRIDINGTLSRTLVNIGDSVSKDQRIGETRDVMGNVLAVRASENGIITSIPSALNNSFVISDLTQFKLVVNISERDISRLVIGQTAEIFIQSLNLTLDGTVSNIGLIGNTALDFTTYPVTVVFEHGDQPLFLGMSASAKISVEVFNDILTIPFEALIIDGTQRFVLSASWLNDIQRPQRDFYIPVTTGVADVYNVQVSGENLEGLEIIVPDPTSSFPFFRR